MTKRHYLSLLLILLSATAMAQQAILPQPVNYGHAIYELSDQNCSAKISITYPLHGTAEFRAAYDSIVLRQVGRLSHLTPDEDDSDVPVRLLHPMPAPRAGEDVAKMMAHHFVDDAKDYIKTIVREHNPRLESGQAPLTSNDLPECSLDLDLSRVIATPRYITYRLFADLYLGGAHGMQYEHYYTLDRATGQHFGLNELFPEEVHNKLRTIVYRNLCETYLAEKGAIPDDMPSLSDFSLPIAPSVGLDHKGIIFLYQPYEILSYSEGLPQCIVPYSQIYAILSEAGKQLVGYQPSKTPKPRNNKSGQR